jgi:hypothetical protein
VYPKVLIPKMAVIITDTRQKRKSTRTYECDGSTEATDPGAHFGPGERPGGASPKKLLRKESKLLKQQGANTDKQSHPPGQASTRSPEKIKWKVQHAKDEEWKGADTDQKIDKIEPQEQKFFTTDHDAKDDNADEQKDNNKNRFATLMEKDIDDDFKADDDEHEQKAEIKKSDATKLPTETTTTPHDSPSISSNQRSCEEEPGTTPQYKQVMRQAKRERRKALLLKTKNKAPPPQTKSNPLYLSKIPNKICLQ